MLALASCILHKQGRSMKINLDCVEHGGRINRDCALTAVYESISLFQHFLKQPFKVAGAPNYRVS